MEEQKVLQRKWYDRAFPPGEKRIIQVSIDTHIKRLKGFIPVQRVPISLNCGCGRGEQSDIFGRSIGMDISFENTTAAATTGPASGPRPASSTPAIKPIPCAHKDRSISKSG